MNTIKWIVLIYCIISLICLFNKGIRHLYLSVFDELFARFTRVNKKSYRVRKKDYIYCLLYCLGDLLIVFLYFILAPIAIIRHLPKGGYKYQYSKVSSENIKPPKPINEEYLIPPVIIKIRKDIPFIPDKQQVIYLENSINSVLNKYISDKYQDICSLFKERNYSFIYIPKLIESIGLEEAKYLNPALNEKTSTLNSSASQGIKDILLSFIDPPISLAGGLLRYREEEEGYYIFSYYQFSNLDETEIWEQFRAYQSAIGYDGNDIFYSIKTFTPDIEPDDNADYDFDWESKKIIEEIRERIDVLKQKGINEMILKSLFSFDLVTLSRLVITNEYRIFLPDYNNMEIVMYPLPKAVFFLFLNHPEGILFKNLPDYRDELIAIYKKVSGRENIDDMEKSINDVVNPTLNSINEKCSRIRETFVKQFDESIAQNYFITGGRAKPKKITLDRELIVLEGVDLKVEIVKTPFEYTKHIKYKEFNYSSTFLKDEDDLPF